MRIELNYKKQVYKGVSLRLEKQPYKRDSWRYSIEDSDKSVVILKKFLLEDGTIKPGVDLDYLFKLRIYTNS